MNKAISSTAATVIDLWSGVSAVLLTPAKPLRPPLLNTGTAFSQPRYCASDGGLYCGENLATGSSRRGAGYGCEQWIASSDSPVPVLQTLKKRGAELETLATCEFDP